MKTLIFRVIFLLFVACSHDRSDFGSESSIPINKKEEQRYKTALIRCYKTGGSRIVKIRSQLRCF